jgi:hypothetical protein
VLILFPEWNRLAKAAGEILVKHGQAALKL